jgi:hypothetical protein
MTTYLDRDAARKGGPAARAVSRYNDLIQDLADRALKPDFAATDWSALAEVVDIANFTRYGNFMEVQTWDEYVAMLHAWASTTPFSSQFKRMTESDSLVFLELQENNANHIVNSLSLYEVNDTGKIFKLHIFLQMKMPEA